jgi:hypothetical protein
MIGWHIRVTVDADEVRMHWRVECFERVALRAVLCMRGAGKIKDSKPENAEPLAE